MKLYNMISGFWTKNVVILSCIYENE